MEFCYSSPSFLSFAFHPPDFLSSIWKLNLNIANSNFTSVSMRKETLTCSRSLCCHVTWIQYDPYHESQDWGSKWVARHQGGCVWTLHINCPLWCSPWSLSPKVMIWTENWPISWHNKYGGCQGPCLKSSAIIGKPQWPPNSPIIIIIIEMLN